MDKFDLEYLLSRQLPTVHGLKTIYGDVELDPEMQAVIKTAMQTLINKRLKQVDKQENS